MDLEKVRGQSLLTVESFGLETNSSLPLIEEQLSLRSVDDIVGRSLALFAVIAVSYGFDRKSALSWLDSERAFKYLAESERFHLVEDAADVSNIQPQVEALNAFAWSLGLVKCLEFDQVCDNDLIKVFPDIKNFENSSAFRARVNVRNLEEIIARLDLAYCLHWAVVHSRISGKKLPPRIRPYVIVERRRALTWILTAEDWDELNLDT